MVLIACLEIVIPARVSAQTFNDVPTGHWAFSFIEILAESGITAGCGGQNFCPEEPVTRSQMAVFLERGMRGSEYSPPAPSGNVFLDVGAGSFAANFIEQLYLDGITAGCGNETYCPNAAVTRDQMAVFLLRARHGSGYSPPPAIGVFADVDFSHWAAAWIEQLAAEGITSGCGGGDYCPGDPVTRAQMAVFLGRTFGLAHKPNIVLGNWTTLGPQRINGPNGRDESGRLSALAVFGPNPSIMYGAGGRRGPVTQTGVLKTTDGGQSWAFMVDGLTDRLVNALWVDQSDPDLVVAATEFEGLFRSTDGGIGWSPVGNFAANVSAASDLAAVDGTLFAATAMGIAQSTDSGASWAMALQTNAPAQVLATGGSSILAMLQDGSILWRMADASWQTVSMNPGTFPWWAAIDPASPDTAFAVVDNFLLRTTDGGTTWTSAAPPPSFGCPQALVFSETSHILFAGCNGSMFRTTDGAQSWTRNAVANGLDIRGLFRAPGGQILAGTDQGLHAADEDLAGWASRSANASISLLYSVAVRDNIIFTAVQDFGPIVSFDGGATWLQREGGTTDLAGGEMGQVLINPGDSRFCYAFTTEGYQYSVDGCLNFQRTSIFGVGVWTDMIAVDPGNPATVYLATEENIYKSTDWGVTMTPTNWPLAPAAAIAVDPLDGQIIYVGTTAAFWRTLDGGITWTMSTLDGTSGYPTTIAIDPTDPQVVLVGLSNGPARGGGVVKSLDRGATFHRTNSGLSTVPRNFVCCGIEMTAIRFNSAGIAALAMHTGVYLSVDRGRSWMNVTNNARSSFISDIQWDGTFLYATTFGSGVLRAEATLTDP